MTAETRLCTRCGKPGDFGRNRGKPGGMKVWCKPCVARDQRIRLLKQSLLILPVRIAVLQAELVSLLAGGEMKPKKRGALMGVAGLRQMDVADISRDPRIVSDWLINEWKLDGAVAARRGRKLR